MKKPVTKITKKYLLYFVLLFTVTFVFSCSSDRSLKKQVYAGLGAPRDQVPFLSDVCKGVLPNGLTYYILKNSKPENFALLALVVNVGSVLEKDAQRGLAHFVEHMAFDGTKHFPKNEIINYLRSVGMRFGADVNASTNFDNTVYSMEVPVQTDKQNIKIDKDILAKAKKACKTRWEKGTVDNFTIAESYAYMSVYNKTDFNAWPFLFDKVTSEDLKNIASKLLSVDYFKVVLDPVKTKS
ncbi:MAG: insulinase family protein [Endomicrobium sp.]|jgi:predicted Zn-dependent peptidase|nr:insulinase family protein [Endomicrobium sp.]